MVGNKSVPAKAESLTWMEQQLNELKAQASPVYSEILDHLMVIRIADQKARNALIHDKTDPHDYISRLEHRLMDIEFNPGANPDSEYPYKRKDGSPATLLATTLLRKFETIQISERLQEAHKRVGDAAKEAEARIRMMKETGLVPTDHVIKSAEPEWASTLPDQIIGDADYKGVTPFDEPAIVQPAPAPFDRWSADAVIKATVSITTNVANFKGEKLATYVKDVLVPLHKDVMAELHIRAGGEGPATEHEHLFNFMRAVSTQINTARATLAPNVTTVTQTAGSPFARAVAAATAKAEPVEAAAPVAQTLWQRLSGVGEAVGNLFTGTAKWVGHAVQSAFPKPLRQVATALALGTLVSTAQHAETPPTPSAEAGAKATLVVKADPAAQRASVGVIAQAPVITASVAETSVPEAVKSAATAPDAEPVRKATVAPAPRTARTDFSAQVTTAQAPEVPDELSVTFNGKKLKADIFTVKAACDQISNASSICENFVGPAPKQG